MAATKSPPEHSLAESLREVIRQALADGWSLNALARAVGLPQPNLHAFLNGHRLLSLPSAQKLTDWAGIRLTRPRRLPRPHCPGNSESPKPPH